MREIKFRVWHKWDGEQMMSICKLDDLLWKYGMNILTYDKDAKIMQYTGLKVKMAQKFMKEIF